jgi:hypothetical protein
MNAHEILGVPADADLATIKYLFKILAQRYHPDKWDGDAKEYEKIRAAYDELTKQAPDPNEQLEMNAITVLSQLFMQIALCDEPGDLIAGARTLLFREIETVESNVVQLVEQKAILENNRRRITTTAAENLFHGLVDSQLQTLEASLEQNKEGLKMCKRAMEILATYSDLTPKPATNRPQQARFLSQGQYDGTFPEY